jgi:hypothetical protein
MVNKLVNSKWFTKIDCFNGYYQISMEEASIKYTAFICDEGLFEYLVMPMGLTNAPATFQRTMTEIFEKEIMAGYVKVYLDDILIHSTNFYDHINQAFTVVTRLTENKVKVKLSKCEFVKNTIKFVGHEICDGVVRPNKDKVEVLFKYDRPKTLKQLQGFLGLANYFRKYIENFSVRASPLYDLTKNHPSNVKNTKINIEWNDVADEAFNYLRKILTTEPFLILPKVNEPYVLETDASDYAIGAVLSQKREGVNRVIAYFSRIYQKPKKTTQPLKKRC